MMGKGGTQRFGDIPPNQTLYVNNLNDKIKIPELKCCLMELFSTYGEVIDIVASGSWHSKKKGQAFIVYKDISCATNALRTLQGFQFLDKPLKIAYCKSKSDVISHEDGTFKPRARPGQAVAQEDPKKPAAAAPAKGAGKGKMSGKAAGKTAAEAPKSMVAHPAAASKGDDEEKPSNVLFVENLPQEVNEMMLTMLFRQYPGFQEARLIKGRNVAFIEYADEQQAGIAKHGLQGFMVTPEMALKIAFANQ
eukprot:TRINITY_DN112603_c0_g1_i1.p1 TRINITY_DN112603_c0_g1~~TRINITY_DN112603_c0_g1_i1.p1  ORF type:complete len:250 (+),score=80.33 TRINITY_DN112603_c0_g1_i1:103-852(+)